jgi:hypothetical protein
VQDKCQCIELAGNYFSKTQASIDVPMALIIDAMLLLHAADAIGL